MQASSSRRQERRLKLLKTMKLLKLFTFYPIEKLPLTMMGWLACGMGKLESSSSSVSGGGGRGGAEFMGSGGLGGARSVNTRKGVNMVVNLIQVIQFE